MNHPTERPATRWIAALLILIAVAHLFAAQLAWVNIPLQTDTGMWAYIGGRILDGALPYRDLWESKPPGIYYTFAAVEAIVGRGGDSAFRWLDALVSLSAFALTYAMARRHAGRLAAAAVLVPLSLVFCHRILADWGCNLEKFVAIFELLALGCMPRAVREQYAARHWLLAGICVGLAATFKQTGVILGIASTIALLTAGRVRAPGRAIIRIWLGAALVWLPIVIALLAAGMFRPFWQQVVVFDLARIAGAAGEHGALLTAAHWQAVWFALRFALVLFVPALLLTVMRHDGAAADSPDAPGMAARIIVNWWLIATMVFMLAPQGYGHYLLQAAAPAAILLAWGIGHAPTMTNRRFVVAALLVVACIWFQRDHLRFTFDADSPFRRAYAERRHKTNTSVDILRGVSMPDQRVMLWPPDYAVSYYARRVTPLESSNSDVIFKNRLQRLRPPTPELVERLATHPPDWIVDATPTGVEIDADGHPHLLVTARGFALIEPPDPGHAFPEGRALAPLKAWVRTHYGNQRRIGPTIVYERGGEWRPWTDVLPSPPSDETGAASP